jgi:REP-associated tyrosine transposase
MLDRMPQSFKEFKPRSSLGIKERASTLAEFAWQSGCGAFAIGFSQIAAVRRYIAGQEEHHRRQSFQIELRQFLKRYEIAHDECYLLGTHRLRSRAATLSG